MKTAKRLIFKENDPLSKISSFLFQVKHEYLYQKVMTPEANIPNRITDVSISLQHPEGQSSNIFPSPQNFNL